MKNEKEILEYEEKINNSPLFSIDKEKSPSLYKREHMKLIENLFLYLQLLNYNDCNVEIVEIARRCIEKYDSTKGSFLNYFKSAWKRKHSYLLGEKELQKVERIKDIPDKKKRNLKKYLQKFGKDPKEREDILSHKEIDEAKDIYDHRTISIYQQNGDKECNLLEQKASRGISPKEEFENVEQGKLIIDTITVTYGECQSRQQDTLSLLITSRLSSEIIGFPFLVEYFKKQPFFNNKIYSHCIQTKHKIEDKEIASRLKKKGTSISRTWKDFKEKIKNKLENQGIMIKFIGKKQMSIQFL